MKPANLTIALLGALISLTAARAADPVQALLQRLADAPGDPVVPDAPFLVLNGSQNYLGKGWDDPQSGRAGALYPFP